MNINICTYFERIKIKKYNLVENLIVWFKEKERERANSLFYCIFLCIYFYRFNMFIT